MTPRAELVGVVGLGRMGRPMAANLIRAGFPTVGYDVDAAVTTAFSTEFGIEDDSPEAFAGVRGRS